MGKYILLWVCIFSTSFAVCQKHSFINYAVPDGLAQSQVTGITQDRFDRLWFSTLGGISCFDGKKFKNYSETDGLIANYTTCLLADHRGNIWVGTTDGISCYDGTGFTNYRPKNMNVSNMCHSVAEDRNGSVFVLEGVHILAVSGGKETMQEINKGEKDTVSAIATDTEGYLWAAVFRKGLYRLSNNRWKLELGFPPMYKSYYFKKIVFDKKDPNRFYLMSPMVLLSVQDHVVAEDLNLPWTGAGNFYQDLYQDNKNNIWLCSRNGLYKISAGKPVLFNLKNGYSDITSNFLFQDREKNLWIATNGGGVYRYSYDPFLLYDQFSNIENAMVIGMIEGEDHHIYLATDGKGIVSVFDSGTTAISIPNGDAGDLHMSGISKGYSDDFYCWTSLGRIFRYNYRTRVFEKKMFPYQPCMTTLLADKAGGYWTGSCRACIYHGPDDSSHIILDAYTSKLFQLAGDSVLIVSQKGLFLCIDKKNMQKITDPLIDGSMIMCIGEFKNFYLIATGNRGLLIYNTENKSCRQLSTKDGLNTDFVYSIVIDSASHLWLGTGRGVNEVIMDFSTGASTVLNHSSTNNLSASECNEDASVYDYKGNLWFSTIAGLLKYRQSADDSTGYIPKIVLQSVKLFSTEIWSGKQGDGIPLSLSHSENNLSFSYSLPTYRYKGNVMYQYKLEGLDSQFSALTPADYVVYQSLPPGNYIFKARSVIPGLGESPNIIAYPFVINAPLYKKAYFQFLMLALLIGLVPGYQYMRTKTRENRRKQIEDIKEEENKRVRIRTAEDFHDEIGNKLARIQMLAGLLGDQSDIKSAESREQIKSIREDVNSLYRGTRDILWGLRPESDKLLEIADRIGNFGIEIFQGIKTDFLYQYEIDCMLEIILTSEYSRNILMIFKEAITNSLKHAHATEVSFTVDLVEKNEILLKLKDNGAGFDITNIKRGNGLDNMLSRAKRINATLDIDGHPGSGTCYSLRVTIPQ